MMPRVHGENLQHLDIETAASGSRPMAPSTPKPPREVEVEDGLASSIWSMYTSTSFRWFVYENQHRHNELVEAIEEVQHAPGALSEQQAKIKDLQLKIEEGMLNLAKISERLLRLRKSSETADKPKFKLFSVMQRSSSKVGQSQKQKETNVTYLRTVDEEARELEKHVQLKGALFQAAAEERALEEQARKYVSLTNALDTLYDDIFNKSTPGFAEENRLQQQVAAATAVCSRVEATFDAETQAYERLYHAEKALYECLENLKETLRSATSPTGMTFERYGSAHEKESACLQIAHAAASPVPSLIHEARQFSPSVKPLGSLAISQSVPVRIELRGGGFRLERELLEDVISETVQSECSTYSGRTAGAQSVLEGAAQTLTRYRDELRAARKRIFIEEVAARSTSPLSFEACEDPPPAYSPDSEREGWMSAPESPTPFVLLNGARCDRHPHPVDCHCMSSPAAMAGNTRAFGSTREEKRPRTPPPGLRALQAW
ncbi:hypothetical protein AAF712_015258 [Marasmius tenuissimus]|uniref:Uncharacterized protein n=1 Tax=Marasmius tenuissimus TaxID=585030 RepID=A0ABR2ZAV1_9AGAR